MNLVFRNRKQKKMMATKVATMKERGKTREEKKNKIVQGIDSSLQ
jgi:hypothetical protein